MINKNDLRVGNYIERYNKVTGIEDVVQVDGGTPFLAFKGMATLIFNPIPLTEEWMLNFGFNVSEGLFGESYTLNDISILTATKGNLCFCWDRFMKEIKYVHQLQNLYFALTGEEITLHNGSI